MKLLVRSLVLASALVAGAGRADALPILQLDIIGGHYDPVTQTIVSAGRDFTLVALLTPKPNNVAEGLADTYYISAAVTPQAGPTHASLGSFTWDGTGYDVTGDMIYGTPPTEATGAEFDPGDLAPHSIFPTFFREFALRFTPDQRTVTYDSALHPGGLTPTTATTNVSYYQLFTLTTAFAGDHVLHFDLYSTGFVRCAQQPGCVVDEDVQWFAPFSHDAQSTNRVPEPASALLLSLGLAGAVRSLRRRPS